MLIVDKMDIAFKEDVLKGLKSGFDLVELAEKYKDLGMDKESMYHTLEVLMLEMRENKDEASENQIMDLMDRVVGWCNPDSRLFPEA